MIFPQTRFLLAVAVAGLVLPASAQQVTIPWPIPTNKVSARKIAFLLDPAHNTAPKDAFALWPGLPYLKDLSLQAARLFTPAPALGIPLEAGVGFIVPTQGNEGGSVTVQFTSGPNVDMSPGTPLGNTINRITWLCQDNPSREVAATLWRFKNEDEIPEPFAEMLRDWDGKTPLMREVDLKVIHDIVITANYYKHASRYRLTPAVPLEMEFHSPLAAEKNNPVPPQDHVRITAVRTLREGEKEISAQSPMAALIDSPAGLWEPVEVPKFSPQKELVVLLPENHDTDGVKATFLQFHIWLPG